MRLKFSQDLEGLLKRLANKPLTLAEILSETSEHSFSLIISLLSFPFLFPMPPGLTTILGSGSFLLGIQMALGRKSPWLPRRIAQFSFPRSFLETLLKNLNRVTRRLEKITRPRWFFIAKNPSIWRINGLCIAWLAILLMLPIPFTNPLPTIGILLLSISLLEADGLLMCISYGLTILITLVFALIFYSGWQAMDWLPRLFP